MSHAEKKKLTAQVEQEAKVDSDAEGGAHVNECDREGGTGPLRKRSGQSPDSKDGAHADDHDRGGIGDQMLTKGDSNLSSDLSRSLSSTESFVQHVSQESHTGRVNVDQDERDVGAGSPHEWSGPGSCTSDETEDTMLLARPVTRSGQRVTDVRKNGTDGVTQVTIECVRRADGSVEHFSGHERKLQVD